MFLPDYVRECVDALEAGGFPAYAVGGCVRDFLLGMTPHDYDLCTAATPAQIKQVFHNRQLVLAGEKHGTVSVVTQAGLVEITTFRTEGSYEDGRHPDWVRFVTDIAQDLSRRDFTVNAMAYSPTRGLADPFGGREDLKNHVLRAVGDPKVRFQEDALRILRGARFSVRYGLAVEPATFDAMLSLAPLMDRLARERVFDELNKLLPLVNAADLLTFAPLITQVIPELAPAVGFDQHSPYHAYDVFTHTACVVQSMPPDITLRWAALLHDVGKPETFDIDENGRGHFPNHARVGEEIANAVLLRLKSSTVLREQVTALIARHMTPLEPDKKLLRRRLGKYGVDATRQLLTLQRADFGCKGTKAQTDFFDRTEALLEELLSEDACLRIKDLAVDGHDLMALGFAPGPGIGNCLAWLLGLVQEERLPNEKQPLLEAARHYQK